MNREQLRERSQELQADTTCIQCLKGYPAQENIRVTVINTRTGDKQVELVCPHCGLAVHCFYTSPVFEMRTARIRSLMERYRQSRKPQHYQEAKTAQDAYRRAFTDFNTRLERKYKPLTRERWQKEQADALRD